MTVDIDLITELRQSGRKREADEILTTWRENVEENKRHQAREIRRDDRKKRMISPEYREKVKLRQKKYCKKSYWKKKNGKKEQ